LINIKGDELRKTVKRVAQAVATLTIALCLFVAFIYVSREGNTPPFLDGQGDPVAGSVAEMRWLSLGGVDQSVVIRGRSRNAPILIWLHGGPGFPETGLFRRYNAVLEEHFLVVYWTQRGAGRSYSPNIPRSSMTLPQFVDDLDELVIYLQGRFGQRAVVLAAHSWGTSIGVAYAQAHPDKVAAYVSIGQVVNTQEGELRSYRYALAQARERQDREGIEVLTQLGPPPYQQWQINAQRVWLERYGGGVFREPTSLYATLWDSLQEPEVTLYDLALLGPGTSFSQNALVAENALVDWPRRARSFAMPVFMISGRNDYMTDGRLAYDYFTQIEAPLKDFKWFEASAHSPMFEEADAFNAYFIENVLPLVHTQQSARVGTQ
jgi:proline iminopeptidase